jgi:hypothetical protein
MQMKLTHYYIGMEHYIRSRGEALFQLSLQSLVVTPNWHLLLILQQVLILQVFPDPSFWGQWMGSSTGNSTKYYYITLAHPGSALIPNPDVEPCWARQIEIYFCPSVIHKMRRECWFFCLPCPAQPSPATWHPSGWDLVPKAKSPRESVLGRIGHQLPILLSTPSLDSPSYLALTLPGSPGEGFSGRIDNWGPIPKYVIINLTSVGGGKEKGGGRVGGVHE